MLSAAVIQPQGHRIGKVGVLKKYAALAESAATFMASESSKVAQGKAGERALLIMYGSQVDDLKTARLQKFQTKVATAAGYVPPEKLQPTSDAAAVCKYKHGKGTSFLPSGDGRDPQQALFLCKCQRQQPHRSSCETSDVIVVADVIHDLASTSRTACSALQRAFNVRALRAKTFCKWIVRILMTLLTMISETNDTANSNCCVNLNLL